MDLRGKKVMVLGLARTVVSQFGQVSVVDLATGQALSYRGDEPWYLASGIKVPVAIALISGASAHELPWGNIMAASVIVTVPIIIIVLLFQRKIVAGLTSGAVKG